MRSRVPSLRPTPRSLVYVLAVAVLATVGFIQQSPWPILLAAVLSLPASVVALPCYYLAYGVLALVPGANPSSSTGSGTTVTTGTPAAWFTITTDVLGVLTLTVAAVVDVLLVRALVARQRDRAALTG